MCPGAVILTSPPRLTSHGRRTAVDSAAEDAKIASIRRSCCRILSHDLCYADSDLNYLHSVLLYITPDSIVRICDYESSWQELGIQSVNVYVNSNYTS